MYTLNVSAIEYQGISIIKKDCREIQKLIGQYYKNVPIRNNLHMCLEYFGNTRKIDDCIIKQDRILPQSCIGKQIILPAIGIGEYRKNGKIMNIALLIDADTALTQMKIEDRTLYDYFHNDCPNITVYTRNETYTDEKGKVRPVTSAKKSNKCFMPEALEEGETQNFIPFYEPVSLIGQVAVFYRTSAAYHVNMNAPRLVTKHAINETMQEMLSYEFEVPENDKRKEKSEEKTDKKLEADEVESILFGN